MVCIEAAIPTRTPGPMKIGPEYFAIPTDFFADYGQVLRGCIAAASGLIVLFVAFVSFCSRRVCCALGIESRYSVRLFSKHKQTKKTKTSMGLEVGHRVLRLALLSYLADAV